jgi:hypothetical protein
MRFSISAKAFRWIGRAALFVFWLCVFAEATLSQALSETLGDLSFWAVVAAFILLGSLALAAYVVALKLGQSQKTREHEQALNEALSGNTLQPIILFLRSFTLAESSLASRIGRNLVQLLVAFLARDGVEHYDADEELDNAIGAKALFVAIGDKHMSYGSFKLIVPDEKWQEIFFRLAHLAKLIVMMPGPSTSTIWEMSEILSSPEYLEKSVFMMPRINNLSSAPKEKVSWAALVEVVAKEFDVRLPAYRKDGCYFRLGKDRRLAATTQLEAFTRGLRKYLARQKGSDGFSIADIWNAAR